MKDRLTVKKPCIICGEIIPKGHKVLCGAENCQLAHHRMREKKYENKNPVLVKENQAKYRSRNKEKVNKRTKEWRLKNREHVKRYKREHPELSRLYAWKDKNPELVKQQKVLSTIKRRARIKTGVNIRIDMKALDKKMTDNFIGCCYCGRLIKLEIEHLIPIACGGTNSPLNLFKACRECNASKSKLDWDKWYKEQAFYNSQRESVIRGCSCAG